MRKHSKKLTAVIAGTAAAVAVSGVAYAYFTTTGAGDGSGTVGSSTALVLHQSSIVYSNASSDNALVPGTSGSVTFTVDNPSSGHQYLDKIHLASWESDKAGCNKSTDANPTAETAWITMPDVSVAKDYDAGNGQAVTPKGTVTFNNVASSQDACKGAAITLHFTSN